MAVASPDEEDIVWEDDDPDFALALGLYMDELESSQASQREASDVHVDSSGEDVECWTKDDPDFDLALAMYLDQVEEKERLNGCATGGDPAMAALDEADRLSMQGCVVDPRLEDMDPNPDIWHLFRLFDDRFFDGKLKANGVMLGWSPRMTSCAGLCSWNTRAKFCEIKLSQPLLLLRPRGDLVETLIHEMIHALLFVTHQDDNHESHGAIFHSHMFRINKIAGCNITVFHNFHDEVRFYQKHVWKCDGPCRQRPPYFGVVRRAMNRAPGPRDYWFPRHQASCGGTFVKVEGPEPQSKSTVHGKEKLKRTPVKRPPKGTPDIRNFFPASPDKRFPASSLSSSEQPASQSGAATPVLKPPVVRSNLFSGTSGEAAASAPNFALNLPASFVPFSGVGHVLGRGTTHTSVSSDRLPGCQTACSSRSSTLQSPDPVMEVIELD